MPRKDKIHEAVKKALVKDGWTITDDPFRIHYEDVDVYADLRVDKLEEDTGSRRAIIIEVKTFEEASAINELENALGQYLTYRTFLKAAALDFPLYLAISEPIYQKQFQRKSFQLIVGEHHVSVLVVNVTAEEIVVWIN